MIIADNVATAANEIEAALERVSQRIIGEQLCVLDNSIGMSMTKLVLMKFQLSQSEQKIQSEVSSVPEAEWTTSRPTLTLAAAAGQTTHLADLESGPIIVTPEISEEPFPRVVNHEEGSTNE